MPLFGQDSVEETGKHWVKREGSGIGKRPRAGIQTRVAVSAVALYVGTPTARLLAPTTEINSILKYIKMDNSFFSVIIIYYCFHSIFDQINAALVSKGDSKNS